MNTSNQNIVSVQQRAVQEILDIEDNYSYHIRCFALWLQDTGRDFDPESVFDFVVELNQSDYSASTKRIKRQAIKKRLKQLMQGADYEQYARAKQFLDRLDEDFRTKAPKINDISVGTEKLIDATECRRMIHASTPRQACFIRFLWETGCRVSELTGIKKGHILDKGDKVVTLRVTGKGNKERIVKITRQLYDYIQRTFRSELWLFETGGAKPYSRVYVSEQIKKVAKRAIDRRISAHCLRHSFITRKVAAHPGHIPAISKYVGHSNVSITLQMYVHNKLSDEQLLDDAILFGGENEG